MGNVLVLLSTYNGDKFLNELLNSIFQQKDVNISLLVRDDGSHDSTLEILEKWKENHLIKIVKGKNLGAKNSFYELINMADNYDYYAFCDQDDVWEQNKLSEAIKLLEACDNVNKPKLYASNYTLVDEKLRTLNIQVTDNKAYTFNQIIVKNHAIGCTMVCNNILMNFLKKTRKEQYALLPYHDHWAYIVCLAMKGDVYFDQSSHILYRQHINNVVGGNRSIFAKIKNSSLIKKNIRSNYLSILNTNYFNDICTDYIDLIECVIKSKKSFKYRIKLIHRKYLMTNSFIEKVVLNLTILTGRI